MKVKMFFKDKVFTFINQEKQYTNKSLINKLPHSLGVFYLNSKCF